MAIAPGDDPADVFDPTELCCPCGCSRLESLDITIERALVPPIGKIYFSRNARQATVKGGPPRYSRDQGEFDRAIAFVDATFALA